MTGVTTEDAYASLYTESFVPKTSDGKKQRPPAFFFLQKFGDHEAQERWSSFTVL